MFYVFIKILEGCQKVNLLKKEEKEEKVSNLDKVIGLNIMDEIRYYMDFIKNNEIH